MRSLPSTVSALALAVACTACRTEGGAAPDGGVTCSGTADAADLACVLHVDGTVTDVGGAPVGHAAVSMCSRTCYGAAADGAGRFSIPVGDFLRASDYALHVSGRPDFADVYLKVLPPVNGVIALPQTVRLPALPPAGPALPASAGPAATITSGELSLDVPAGVTFTLDVGDVALGARGRELRVANVGLDAMPDFARSLAGVAALYAIAPPGAVSSARLGVHLTNSTALPASSAVDLFVLDDDYAPLPPTAGSARLAAKAHVSADAHTIDTDLGEGITSLTWIVVVRSP